MLQHIRRNLVVALAASVGTFVSVRALAVEEGPLDPRGELLHDVDHPWSFEPHFTDRQQWEKRAKEVREQVLVAEGLWPMPAKTPLNAVIHGKIERDGYTIEKVFFASTPGHYVSGNLYRPTGKTGRLPAVLSPHGHWADGRMYENSEAAAKKQIAEGAEKTMEGARYPLQARCAMLARMGCVVFHYDMVGYADSTAIPHREGFTDAEAVLRLQSFMGLQTWNSIRSLDFLLSLPDVDPHRIAVTGASGGGTQTMILDAIDDRPAVGFPAVMVSAAMQGGCICENAPLLRIHTNNTEFASTFAPKPEGMTSANDWTRELLTKGFPQIKAIYHLYDADDDVAAWYRPFEHNYNQVSRELMYNWMNHWLKLGLPEPVTETPFVPVPPKELSVYDAEHPRPADELNAAGLRKKMTAASDEQMRDLAKDAAKYREVVGTALRVMINDSLPSADDVSLLPAAASPVRQGVRIQHAMIERKSAGVRLPCVLLTPTEWNGTIAVWAHPDGKSSVLSGDNINADARRLLDRRCAILAADAFEIGLLAEGKPVGQSGKYSGYNYAGYYFGYNPSALAHRASDVLTAIAAAKAQPGVKEVDLIAFGKAGVWSLLARALAGDAVNRAAIDLNHFDFTKVHDAGDEMMLPGALKYGGIPGFVPLCTAGETAAWNAPESNGAGPKVATSSVTLKTGEAGADQLAAWLVSSGN